MIRFVVQQHKTSITHPVAKAQEELGPPMNVLVLTLPVKSRRRIVHPKIFRAAPRKKISHPIKRSRCSRTAGVALGRNEYLGFDVTELKCIEGLYSVSAAVKLSVPTNDQ